MMKNVTYILIASVLLSACSGAPWMRKMMDGPPQVEGKKQNLPPLYINGWQDGCETGVSANTNSLNKFFYGFKQDASLVLDDVYYRGWKDGFDYCQRYTRIYYSRQFP